MGRRGEADVRFAASICDEAIGATFVSDTTDPGC